MPEEEAKPSLDSAAGPEFEGFLVDLVERLSKDLDFDYVLRPTDEKGSLDKRSGNWTGGLGKLVNGVRDFNFCKYKIYSAVHRAAMNRVPWVTLKQIS